MFARHFSSGVRPAAVAGSFYPRDTSELTALVDALLSRTTPAVERDLIGVIAPHAGYIYSGPVAASAFAGIGAADRNFERVLLLGPPHYVRVGTIAAPSAEAFATPLGTVKVDRDAIAALLDIGLVTVNDRAHAPEHSLEVELPFLQRLLDRFTLIPLLVGDTSAEETAAVIDTVLDERTLLVVSTDLSHYLDNASAKTRDNSTAEAIERLDFTRLGPEHACGFAALNGALCFGHAKRCSIKRLDLRNSGDTSGDLSRVVGYGAWAMSQAMPVAA